MTVLCVCVCGLRGIFQYSDSFGEHRRNDAKKKKETAADARYSVYLRYRCKGTNTEAAHPHLALINILETVPCVRATVFTYICKHAHYTHSHTNVCMYKHIHIQTHTTAHTKTCMHRKNAI